jgi:lysophospholipase L1-like esterase
VLPSIIPSPEQAKIRFLVRLVHSHPFIISAHKPQTISFGTNDASIAGAPNKQHIPLEEFRANLEKIITHPQITAHNPRIILVAPPPVNEHLWLLRDQASGYSSVTRNAAKTKEYADAVVELGVKLDLPVVNLWKAFMMQVDPAWEEGDALPGSLDIRQNHKLAELLYDGRLLVVRKITHH